MSSSSYGDFSHILANRQECTYVTPCLIVRLECQSRHEIDMSRLNRTQFVQFVKNAVEGKCDTIQLPGNNCGQWACKNWVLTVEIYDYGQVYGYLRVNLKKNDNKWGKRFTSIVKSIEKWETGRYKLIEMEYDKYDTEVLNEYTERRMEKIQGKQLLVHNKTDRKV